MTMAIFLDSNLRGSLDSCTYKDIWHLANVVRRRTGSRLLKCVMIQSLFDLQAPTPLTCA